MFFLSYGCINKILNRRVSLFDRAATSAISSLNTSFRLDLFSELSVCKCLEVNECGEIQESLLKLVLNDGQQSLRVYVNLDESKHNLRHTYESQEHCLDVGCVLLLLEYSHVQVKDLLGKTLLVNQLVDNIDLNESVIKLNSFLLLGHDDDDDDDQVKSSQKLLEAVQLHDQEEKEQDDNVMPRHTIESVRVDLSNSAWSLKCQVVERSLKLTFVHRDTLKEGHKMRLLLFDGLKYIECVAFDEHISRIESLTLERIYLIQNANVNVSKRLYKSWPNQADSVSEYDLGVKKETNFILLNEKHATLAQRNSDHQLKEKKNTPPPPSREEQSSEVDKSERASSEDDELVKETDNEQEEEKKELVLGNKKQTPRMRGLDFKSITEIHKMKSANELVNVMGIVHTVYDAEMVSDSRKAPLSLLNIQLIDKAKYPIKVSLWGREADTFSHSVGDFLAFKSIKTMLYKNKISLSKTVKCEMLCEHDFDLNKCSAISDLTRWYADYAKVKKKKNSPSSREASSHSLVKKTKI